MSLRLDEEEIWFLCACACACVRAKQARKIEFVSARLFCMRCGSSFVFMQANKRTYRLANASLLTIASCRERQHNRSGFLEDSESCCLIVPEAAAITIQRYQS